MTGYEALWKEANAGRITREQVMDVARRLKEDEPGADTTRLLSILGQACLTIPGQAGLPGLVREDWYREAVERFLEYQRDPALSWQALGIVFNYWGEGEKYLDPLYRYVEGVPWDQHEDVRVQAIMIAGSFLSSHRDSALLTKLIEIFEDGRESIGRRQDAYQALGWAMGWSQDRIPPVHGQRNVPAGGQEKSPPLGLRF